MQNTQIFNATTEDRYTVIATHYTGETMDGCAMFDCVIFDTQTGDAYVQENCMCMDCALLQTEGVAECITYKQYKKQVDSVCVVCYNKHTAQTQRPRCKVVGQTHKLF